MKAPLAFDPLDYHYGPATSAVQSVLAEWSDIDWFEPSESDPVDAENLFREHQRLAHAYDPQTFPATIHIDHVEGDWSAFATWSHRVRSNTTWSWKFSALKPLSSKHEKACGWSPEAEAPAVGAPRPGDLFIAMGDANGKPHVLWHSLLPPLPGIDRLPHSEVARFYLGYAHAEALDCIKWQLAERSADLSRNPFLPLLLCYAAGAYPFSLARDTVALFRFS